MKSRSKSSNHLTYYSHIIVIFIVDAQNATPVQHRDDCTQCWELLLSVDLTTATLPPEPQVGAGYWTHNISIRLELETNLRKN